MTTVAVAYINKGDPKQVEKPVDPVSNLVTPPPEPKNDTKPAPEPEPPAPAKLLSINGTWNYGGLAAQVTQNGDAADLIVPSATPMGMVNYTGSATIEGNRLSWNFSSPIGDNGRCDDIVISGNGDRLQGSCLHENGARTPFLMTR